MSPGYSSALQHGQLWKSTLALCRVSPQPPHLPLTLPLFSIPSIRIKASYDLASVSNLIARPPQVLEFSLTNLLACLPSLRPILVAILGDSALSSNQKANVGNNNNRKKAHTGYSSSVGHSLRTNPHQESYMEVGGGDSWDLSDQRGLDRDIVVTHDVSVQGSGFDN